MKFSWRGDHGEQTGKKLLASLSGNHVVRARQIGTNDIFRGFKFDGQEEK
jgi:hypothetical protein